MRIALLTLATPAVAAVGRLSGPGWRAYARRHGYDFLPFGRTPDPARHPYWGKVRLLLDHLDRPATTGSSGAKPTLGSDVAEPVEACEVT